MDETRVTHLSRRRNGSQTQAPTRQQTKETGDRPANDYTGADQKREDGRTSALPDLTPFADQLMAIARQLRDESVGLANSTNGEAAKSIPLSAGRKGHASVGLLGPSENPEDRRAEFAGLARKAYSARRQRGAIFGNAELFGEPAWDILLDLYIAHAEGKNVSVSSACIGSAAPPTTGLRWLGVLADNGLVLREHDPEDQRRVLVRLSARGLAAMDHYFALAAGIV